MALPGERLVICPKRKGRWWKLLRCLLCEKYPCAYLEPRDIAELEGSPLVTIDTQASRLVVRRGARHMYIFETDDGNLIQAYSNFDPQAPDFDRLRNVKAVHYVSRTLVKQMKLVPKPAEEQEKARAEATAGARRRQPKGRV